MVVVGIVFVGGKDVIGTKIEALGSRRHGWSLSFKTIQREKSENSVMKDMKICGVELLITLHLIVKTKFRSYLQN